MIELLKHAFGLCGEGHVSVVPLLLSGGAGFWIGWAWLKSKFNHEHESCEECNKEGEK